MRGRGGLGSRRKNGNALVGRRNCHSLDQVLVFPQLRASPAQAVSFRSARYPFSRAENFASRSSGGRLRGCVSCLPNARTTDRRSQSCQNRPSGKSPERYDPRNRDGGAHAHARAAILPAEARRQRRRPPPQRALPPSLQTARIARSKPVWIVCPASVFEACWRPRPRSPPGPAPLPLEPSRHVVLEQPRARRTEVKRSRR